MNEYALSNVQMQPITLSFVPRKYKVAQRSNVASKPHHQHASKQTPRNRPILSRHPPSSLTPSTMPAASGEQNNYGPNPGSVKSGQKVKTTLPAIGYIVIIAVFLIIAVVGAAGIYGCILRKRRLARQRTNEHEMFAPVVMSGGAVSRPDALRWTETSERREKVGVSALPRL